MTLDRRSTLRVHAYRPVKLHPQGRSHLIVETLTKDIATGGLRCLSSSILPVSTLIELEVVLNKGSEPLNVRGRTVWFRTIPQSEQFDVGIAFLDLSGISKRRLSTYIDDLSRQDSASQSSTRI